MRTYLKFAGIVYVVASFYVVTEKLDTAIGLHLVGMGALLIQSFWPRQGIVGDNE